MSQPKSPEFNQAPKHEHSYCSCPRCGYSQEDADDRHDEGKTDSPHVWLLEYIEQREDGVAVVWCQYECQKCFDHGVFSVMGPRTLNDLERKQRDAINKARGDK